MLRTLLRRWAPVMALAVCLCTATEAQVAFSALDIELIGLHGSATREAHLDVIGR